MSCEQTSEIPPFRFSAGGSGKPLPPVWRGLGADTMLVARLGRKLYVTSKLTAVFIATAIVFSVPFLLEIVLNCLSFPLTATGNLAGIDVFDSDYAEMLGNYLCPWLYRFSPYLAAVLGTIGFGLFAGLLACVTASLSLFVRIRFRVFLLLPVFILLYAINSSEDLERKWYTYLLFFNELDIDKAQRRRQQKR